MSAISAKCELIKQLGEKVLYQKIARVVSVFVTVCAQEESRPVLVVAQNVAIKALIETLRNELHILLSASRYKERLVRPSDEELNAVDTSKVDGLLNDILDEVLTVSEELINYSFQNVERN